MMLFPVLTDMVRDELHPPVTVATNPGLLMVPELTTIWPMLVLKHALTVLLSWTLLFILMGTLMVL